MSEHSIRRADKTAALDDLLALYDRQVDELYAYVLRRVGKVELAEDVTHDVFITAARRFQEAGEIPAPAWLYHSARSRIIDHWRREGRRVSKLRLVGAGRAERMTDPADGVALVHDLWAALDGLSADHRSALVLRYVEDLSVNEIAATLGRSVRATESLLVRARRSLQESYGSHADE